jgi:hypothetical protein
MLWSRSGSGTRPGCQRWPGRRTLRRGPENRANENAVCPRDTVCVVNTATTLGATFSTTGPKVVIIPSRVCCGCCAMTGDRLVFMDKTVSAKRPHDLRIPFSTNGLLAKKNRTHSRRRLFFDLVRRWESRPYAPVATERWSSRQIECGCSRVSVRRVSTALTIVACASHSEAATAVMGEAVVLAEAAVLA